MDKIEKAVEALDGDPQKAMNPEEFKENKLLAIDLNGRYWWENQEPGSSRGLGCYQIICSYREFRAKREELSSKPSWDDAPELAEWLAQDADGWWHWYAERPMLLSSLWKSSGKEWCQFRGREFNWLTSLERRPRIECPNREEASESAWVPGETLPRAGTVCEVNPGQDYVGEWYECRIIGEDDGSAVFRPIEANFPLGYGYFSASPAFFREQKACRDKVVEAALSVIAGHDEWAEKGLKASLYDLYDTGMLKFPENFV